MDDGVTCGPLDLVPAGIGAYFSGPFRYSKLRCRRQTHPQILHFLVKSVVLISLGQMKLIVNVSCGVRMRNGVVTLPGYAERARQKVGYNDFLELAQRRNAVEMGQTTHRKN